jgi:hypothetical protein
MTVYLIDPAVEKMNPPASSIGVVGWARANLFNGVFNSILTLLTLALLWQAVPPCSMGLHRRPLGQRWGGLSRRWRGLLVGDHH